MIWLFFKTPGMTLPGDQQVCTHHNYSRGYLAGFCRTVRTYRRTNLRTCLPYFFWSVAYSDLRFTAPKQRSIQRHISISLSDTKPSLPGRRHPVQPTSRLSSQPTTRASNGSALKVRGNLSDDGVHNDVMRTKRRRILRIRGRFNTLFFDSKYTIPKTRILVVHKSKQRHDHG